MQKSVIPSILQKISKLANSKDIKCFLVGGAVRDILMNRKVSDIDIVVDTNPYDFTDYLAEIFGGRPVVLDESRSNICRLAGIENLPYQESNQLAPTVYNSNWN